MYLGFKIDVQRWGAVFYLSDCVKGIDYQWIDYQSNTTTTTTTTTTNNNNNNNNNNELLLLLLCPGRGSSLGSETHPAFIYYLIIIMECD